MDDHEKRPVDAVFLVVFDQKIGYTTAWKRHIDGVDVDTVEYKSLPSGLHAVKEDLVYFTKDEHVGVSAFVQGEADAKHRNASFVAVGALVARTYGQLGRSWLLADELRTVAKEVVKNTPDTRVLELFWKRHRPDKASASSVKSGKSAVKVIQPTIEAGGKKRKRALSEATLAGFENEVVWPKDHPALFVPALLDTFGPLLFPLHRAALLRKRILLLGSPPVQRQANVVYLLSVLSNISRSLGETLPPLAEPYLQSNPLYSVGVSDLPQLVNQDQNDTWIACSTDDILGEKKDCHDLLVVLPSFQEKPRREWPKLKLPDGTLVKATDRDVRRWRLLRREIRRLQRQSEDDVVNDNEDEQRPLLGRKLQDDVQNDSRLRQHHESEIVEPATWSALAYRGFMWWASAGEAQAWESDEAQADEELLFDMPDLAGVLSSPADTTDGDKDERDYRYARAAATLLVAYFRRVTEQILQTLTNIVEYADDQTEGGIEENAIDLNMDDLRAMGLDNWSETDKAFAVEMTRVWFDHEARVIGGGVRICGVRVC